MCISSSGAAAYICLDGLGADDLLLDREAFLHSVLGRGGGLGRQRQLHAAFGEYVVDKVADLVADEADRVLPLPLDVTETAQMRNAVRNAETKFGVTTSTSAHCLRRSSSARSR